MARLVVYNTSDNQPTQDAPFNCGQWTNLQPTNCPNAVVWPLTGSMSGRPLLGSRGPSGRAYRVTVKVDNIYAGITASYTLRITRTARPGYNIGGTSTGDAPLMAPLPAAVKASVHPYEPRQYWKVHLSPGETIKLIGRGRTPVSSGNWARLLVTVYKPNGSYSIVGDYWYSGGPDVWNSFESSTFTNTTGSEGDFWVAAEALYRVVDMQATIVKNGVLPQLSLFLDVLDPNAQPDFNVADPQSDLPTFVPGARQNDAPSPLGPKKGSSVPLPQTAQIIAAYTDAAGQITVPPSSGNVTFSLTGVSAFDGVAMNAPLPAGAPTDDIVATSATSVPFGADNMARLDLAVWDYGGFGTVTATHGAVAEFLRLPKSDDPDWIPDGGWRVFDFAQELDLVADTGDLDSEDIDSSVNANSPGDGLSRFEEFRGFFVFGEHMRTDPSHQDVFALSEFMVEGIGDADLLPVRWHLIGASEHSSRKIAPYFTNSNPGAGGNIPGHFVGTLLNGASREQQIVSVSKNETLPWPSQPPYFIGLTDSQTDSNGKSVLGPPWTIGSGSAVFMLRLRTVSPTNSSPTLTDDVDTQKTRQTIAHEIGHNLAMADVNHPQDTTVTPPVPLCPPTATTVMVTEYFTPSTVVNCAWGAIPHQYDPGDLAQLQVK
jgi:hypothetical protein